MEAIVLSLRACTFPLETVYRRCLVMNYSGILVSCHNMYTDLLKCGNVVWYCEVGVVHEL
jgi:hypothetical protein